jgi:hypothetical protein
LSCGDDPAPKITRTGRLPSGVKFTDNGDEAAFLDRPIEVVPLDLG